MPVIFIGASVIQDADQGDDQKPACYPPHAEEWLLSIFHKIEWPVNRLCKASLQMNNETQLPDCRPRRLPSPLPRATPSVKTLAKMISIEGPTLSTKRRTWFETKRRKATDAIENNDPGLNSRATEEAAKATRKSGEQTADALEEAAKREREKK